MSEAVDESGELEEPLGWEDLVSLMARSHMLALICELLSHQDPPVRFNELEEALGVSPNTLSRRLDELGEAGFVRRESYDEIPPRVEYSPTNRLYALEPTAREMAGWLEEYGHQPYALPER